MVKTQGSMILFETKSAIVVVTGMLRPSQNVKTGHMSQTFILSKYRKPTRKVKGAGCEGCPIFEGCYVFWEQAPMAVYKAYKARRYRPFDWGWKDLAYVSRFPMRVGAAGEPTEIPAEEWLQVLRYVKDWTGYTHKWKEPTNMDYRSFCMASVHSVEDMEEANNMGWRTYRVGGGPITDTEIICPHYTRKVQCSQCGLCKGSSIEAKNIYAPAHGANKNKIK